MLYGFMGQITHTWESNTRVISHFNALAGGDPLTIIIIMIKKIYKAQWLRDSVAP